MSTSDTKTATTSTPRDQKAKARHLTDAILESAMSKWQEENEFGGNVDTTARTVSIGTASEGWGELATYRYEFDAFGNIHLWNEEEGEKRPEELDYEPDTDAPASCEGCRSSGLSEAESRTIHTDN
jgi:hypothetical protein